MPICAAKEVKGRSPHGGRGLKLNSLYNRIGRVLSRSPHGGRGLKCSFLPANGDQIGRSPHGGRGLKSTIKSDLIEQNNLVAPRMGGVD